MANSIHIRSDNEALLVVGGSDYKVIPDQSGHCVRQIGDTQIVVPVGVQGNSGLATLAQFTVLMKLYNAALPSYPNEEAASLAGLVSGDEFLWSEDTDVGVAGDKHIMS